MSQRRVLRRRAGSGHSAAIIAFDAQEQRPIAFDAQEQRPKLEATAHPDEFARLTWADPGVGAFCSFRIVHDPCCWFELADDLDSSGHSGVKLAFSNSFGYVVVVRRSISVIYKVLDMDQAVG